MPITLLQEKVHTFKVPDGSQKRLDAFLSANMQSTSRARLQNIIKEGYVAVNGKPASKAGQGIRQGDTVTCELPPPVPIEACPEVLIQPTSLPCLVGCTWSLLDACREARQQKSNRNLSKSSPSTPSPSAHALRATPNAPVPSHEAISGAHAFCNTACCAGPATGGRS